MDVTEGSVGGHLALEFANTISWDPTDVSAGERLDSYPALLDWSLSQGLISRKTHGVLTRLADQQPRVAERTLRDAIDLRLALHEIFGSYARHLSQPPTKATTVFNRAVAELPLKLRFGRAGVDWDWADGPMELGSVLWPVVWAASALLTSPDLEAVKQCAGDRCGWLFVDRSRRHNRKWCDMKDCGNRAKAKRHYYRHRG